MFLLSPRERRSPATSVAPLQVVTKKILADRLRSDFFRRKPAEVICKLTLRLKHWGAMSPSADEINRRSHFEERIRCCLDHGWTETG